VIVPTRYNPRVGGDKNTASQSAESYRSFGAFYPYYLSQHADRTCRRLHFLGTTLGLASIILALATLNFWWLAAGIVAGYAAAWVGHFFYERNKPATFTYPLYSFFGDWVMWSDMLRGRIKF